MLLNKLLINVENKSRDLDKSLKNLLNDYGELYNQSNKLFIQERNNSKTLEGLEDFYHLVQSVKRNKDIIISLIRGYRGLRPLSKFKVVEQNDEKPVKKQSVKKFFESPVVEERLDGEEN